MQKHLKAMEGIFQRKGAARKVCAPAMAHRIMAALLLQANQRGKLQARMSKRCLKLLVTIKRRVKKDPRTKPPDQLTRQRMICLKTVASRVPANQRRLATKFKFLLISGCYCTHPNC